MLYADDHNNIVVKALKESVEKNEEVVLSPEMAGMLLRRLDLQMNNKHSTLTETMHDFCLAPHKALRRSISSFQEEEDGLTLTEDSIHNTLFTYSVLTKPIPAAGVGKRTTVHDGVNKDEENAAHSRLGIHRSISDLAVEHLHQIQSWDFDILKLEQATSTSSLSGKSNHTLALQMVGRTTLQYFGLYENLNLNEKTVHRYLYIVGNDYENTPYHNALHGADVMQTMCASLVTSKPLLDALSSESVFAVLIAAAVHDVGHFGRTNNFLINTHHRLAMVYNDQSVLENYHVARAMELMQQKNCNILESFSEENERKKIRKILIHCVLHTDMAKHMGSLRALDTDLLHAGGVVAAKPDQHVRCLGLLLHCCDVGNPAKEWSIYREWTDRVMQEFNAEYNEETELHIPHGFFDPKKPLHDFQIGFVNFVVKKLYESVNKIDGIDFTRPLHHIMNNLQQWKLMAVEQSALSQQK